MHKLWLLISTWYNAPFTGAIVFWILYLCVYVIAPTDHDVDHDMDMDHDLDHDHDVDHDHDHDVGSGASHGTFHNAITWLGIGRCPLSIILMTLGITWGITGLIMNGVFASKGLSAGLYFWPSLAIATFVGLFLTRWLSFTLGKWIPKSATSAISVKDLVGSTGKVEVLVDKTGGRAQVLDRFGTTHNVICRAKGEEVFRPGEEVLLLQFYEGGEVSFFFVGKKPSLPV